MATKQEATKWIKKVFADDILKEYDDSFDKGYVRIMPSMEVRSFLLVYNYYTGEEILNNSKEGTGNRVYMELSKFVDHFYKVIDTSKSVEDNIYAMIEETYKERKGDLLVAYFRLWLDKITYENFVDIRMVFHKLYKDYVNSYNAETGADSREGTLEAISKANDRFEKFIAIQEATKPLIIRGPGTEDKQYAKEFFCG